MWILQFNCEFNYCFEVREMKSFKVFNSLDDTLMSRQQSTLHIKKLNLLALLVSYIVVQTEQRKQIFTRRSKILLNMPKMLTQKLRSSPVTGVRGRRFFSAEMEYRFHASNITPEDLYDNTLENNVLWIIFPKQLLFKCMILRESYDLLSDFANC